MRPIILHRPSFLNKNLLYAFCVSHLLVFKSCLPLIRSLVINVFVRFANLSWPSVEFVPRDDRWYALTNRSSYCSRVYSL